MEEVTFQIEKITGHADESASCGVFSARVSFGDGTIGTLVSCILVKNAGSEDGASVVKEIFDLANKKLEGAESGSLDILKATGTVSTDFTSQKKLDASFSLALFYKNASYVFRSGDKVKVSVYHGDSSQELSFEHGSGHLKDGQIILMATEKFLSSFKIDDTLKEEGVSLEEVVDGLATEISAKGDQSEIGAALVLVKEGAVDGTAGEDQDAEVVGDEARPAPKEDGDSVLDTSHEIAPPESESVESSTTGDESDSNDEAKPTMEPAQEEQKAQSKFENPLPKVIGAVLSEFSKLRRGEIGAIFRLKRNIVAIAVVVLLVLAASAFLTLRGNADRETESEFSNYLSTASTKYEEGLALLDLNREKARAIFIEADSEVKKALELESENKDALSLESKISDKLKETENLAAVDFSTLVEVEGQLVSLSDADGNLIGVTNGAVHIIDTSSESTQEIEGVSGAKSAFVYDNKVFVFDGEDIFRVDLLDASSEKIVDGQDAQDINVFFGNVYLLGADQIYKYVPVEGGYAQSANYLNEKQQFSINSQLAIDGSIWATNGSEVYEYLRGDRQEFTISGLTSPVGEYGEIYTDSDTDNIYVVDKTNSALLVVSKDGIYSKTYQSGEFGQAVDLVVDEEVGKFYIAVGSKVLASNL